MTLLRILIAVIHPQLSRSHGEGVTYKLVNFYTIPRGELGINLRADIFSSSKELDALQDNRLKNDRLIGIIFLSLFIITLVQVQVEVRYQGQHHCKDWLRKVIKHSLTRRKCLYIFSTDYI